jgi:hypothetical protein
MMQMMAANRQLVDVVDVHHHLMTFLNYALLYRLTIGIDFVYDIHALH